MSQNRKNLLLSLISRYILEPRKKRKAVAAKVMVIVLFALSLNQVLDLVVILPMATSKIRTYA